MPRPPKLTPELSLAITTAVMAGVTLTAAAELADVSAGTMHEWIRRGEGRDPTRRRTPLYAAFAMSIKKARAEDEARRVARIEQAARGGRLIAEKTITTTKPDGSQVTVREVEYSRPEWTADAWHLERSNPRQWGRRDRLELHHYRGMIADEAQRLAADYDLDPEELIREAEDIVRRARLDDEPDWRP